MAWTVLPGMDGLGFERDHRGEVRLAHCTRHPRCAHRFLPESPQHRDPELIHATAVRSAHWNGGCPAPAPLYTAVPSGELRGHLREATRGEGELVRSED